MEELTLDNYKRFLIRIGSVPEPEKTNILREMMRTDLFFLLWFGCGRRDIEHPWLMARCKEVNDNPNNCLDLWARDHRKDLADDTPMLTFNRGWTTHGDLKIGDRVFAPSGNPVKIIALSEQYFDNECYELILNDGEIIKAGAGHLWINNKKRKIRIGDWKKDARKAIYEKEIITTNEIYLRKKDHSNSRIDFGSFDYIKFEYKELPMNPYILGIWLGDGTNKSADITCGYKDIEIIEYIRNTGLEVTERKSSNENSGLFKLGADCRGQKANGNGILRKLKNLNVYNNKHIPDIYLNNDYAQRFELLQGLMDSDGWIDKRGTAKFSSKYERLAKDFYQLVLCLGFKPRYREYESKLYEKSCGTHYEISFQAHTDKEIFKLTRKLERRIKPSKYRNSRYLKEIKKIPSVPTRCIQVEGGLYLAGRTLVPTHNSTIITFGLTIQDILSSHGKDPHPKWGGREPTIGIFSCTRPLAKSFLRQIKREFENNQILKLMFDDILYANPHKEAIKWSEDDGIIVKRKSNPKEATVEAWGLIDGQPTGKHFYTRIYDDVVTIDNVRSPHMMEKTIEAWELSINLGTNGGISRYIGTRYHYNDAYKAIMERGEATIRLYPATQDGTPDGVPVYLSQEELDKKRRGMGHATFAAQMLLNPLADATQGFMEEWIQYHETKAKGNMNTYILVDPANDKKKTSDYTVMIVIGLGTDQNYYVLDMIRDRLNLKERGDALFRLHHKWKPLKVGYESYSIQADIQYIQERMQSQSYHFQIQKLGGILSKNDRIRRLIPLFQDNRFYFPTHLNYTDYEGKIRDLVNVFIQEEYKAFPVSLHDDILDAIARITDEQLGITWPRDEAQSFNYNKYNRSSSAWGV